MDTETQVDSWLTEDLSQYSNIYTANNLPQEKYDRVLCCFVLNVIADEDERVQVLSNCYQLLKLGGLLICEVRKKNGILANKTKTPYNDGFLMGKFDTKTFQKPYDFSDIQDIVKKTKFMLLDMQTCSDSYIVFCRKC